MALFHDRLQKRVPLRVLTADTFATRLIGWLGRRAPAAAELLHLVPCNGVHTFGMQFPIDVVLLDKSSRVVEVFPHLSPNRITSPKVRAASVLEAPPGFILEYDIAPGDKLDISSDGRHQPGFIGLGFVLHWPMNLFIAILWAQLVLYIFNHNLGTLSILGAGVLVHNSLLLLLFLFRRPSQDTSRHWGDWVVAILTLVCAMELRPLTPGWPVGVIAAGILQVIGIAGILFSLLSLGRSFGIIPANRKVQVHGAYRMVRHPLYASELVFYAGFLLGNPSVQNGLLVGFILMGQVWRALAEENLLLRDPVYQLYAAKVRFRFIPGLL